MTSNRPRQLGPFTIDRQIGRGGMGIVFKAEYEGFATPLAIKVLPDTLEDSELRTRFEAEIETLRRLRHPNIVRLFGFGQEEGFLYYAMEFIDGPSLQELLKKGRPFTWEEVVYIGSQVTQALRHAHDRGIIHRDIKPANILLSHSGQIKLSDYGIAHLFGGVHLTNANMVIGTIEYMAPEQATAKPVTPKTDLYSLGALLYVLLASVPPYGETKTLPDLLRKYREAPPESVRFKRPDIPVELDSLLLELLQIAPENRPANAQIVQRRLESILETHAKKGILAKVFEKDVTGHPTDMESPGERITEYSPLFGEELTAVPLVDREAETVTNPSSTTETSVRKPSATSDEDRTRISGEEVANEPTRGIVGESSGIIPMETEGFSLMEEVVDSEGTRPLSSQGTRTVAAKGGEESLADSSDFTLSPSKPASSFHGDLSELSSTDQTVTTRILSDRKEPFEKVSESLSRTAREERRDEEGEGGKTSSPKRKPSHFTRVTEEELDPLETEEDRPSPLSIQVLLFSFILLSIGVFFWYSLRRPSADELYQKIESRLSETTKSSEYLSALRLLDDEFEKFLSYYPNDLRAEKIRDYSRELELANLERRLESQIERGRSNAPLSAVESAYIEAIRTLDHDPDRGMRKLAAFIDIFSFGNAPETPRTEPDGEEESDPSEVEAQTERKDRTLPGLCVVLAKRRLEKLKEDYKEKQAKEEELLKSHLDLANGLDVTDPERARQIRIGLIDFYGDRPWAKPILTEAKERQDYLDRQRGLSGQTESWRDSEMGPDSGMESEGDPEDLSDEGNGDPSLSEEADIP